ncbi:MAG TPA: FAD-dependent oxidoreductase [Acidobacteriaceae bacterium]|nr:FAD-dependent oxidoreductase [Acidobacteriaceae bacterium]
MPAKIAVAGAGIYGATVATRLAESGHSVDLFDPLGILRAASAINQHRVHAGYHYPRSTETIDEILQARAEFHRDFREAIVEKSSNFYAIPHEGSRTSPEIYEQVMSRHGLPLTACSPDWINFHYIHKCYRVDENIYDSDVLREILKKRIESRSVRFQQREFLPEMRSDYDFVIWAVYGLGPSRKMFRSAKYQVAEKALILLPPLLRRVALVVVDGPFTAFDLYGNSQFSLFGSAKHTNHWSTTDPAAPIPQQYMEVLNGETYLPSPFTNFEAMRQECSLSVPAARDAVYLGSRFTIRVVEDDPHGDRRTLRLIETSPGEFHIFSGKVVSSIKAARLICERIAGHELPS